MRFIDPERGADKPVDIFKFISSGEYDQGDVALISYDDLYDMIYDDNRRSDMKKALIPDFPPALQVKVHDDYFPKDKLGRPI